MTGKNLIRIRVALATILFIGICLLFLEDVPAHFLASWQIGPALLAANVPILIVLAILTLLFGRAYCAVFCPLGILQDLLARIHSKARYRPLPPFRPLRLAIAVLFLVSIFAGLPLVFALIDPYSAFGRIAADLFMPIWNIIHNFMAWCAAWFDNDIVIEVFSQPGWGSAAFLGAVAFAALAVVAWKYCRAWCNFCPVGTLLGILSCISFLRVRLNESNCVSCGRCERVCKTGCINIDKKIIDSSRCVNCFNCLAVCPRGALEYGMPVNKEAPSHHMASRRALMAGLTTFALAGPGYAAVIAPGREDKLPERKTKPPRTIPITPPGSIGRDHFSTHCSGCQLCVSVCPGNTLASFSNGLALAQPSLTFEYGYCLQGCTRCGAACPTGAILPFTEAKKQHVQIGLAHVDFDRCIVHTDKVPCRACHNICPPQVISLEPVPELSDDLKRPVVDTSRCIGCGACEFVCPARPIAAITVDGKLDHSQTGPEKS